MSTSSASDGNNVSTSADESANPREHNENAAEGSDGADMPEIRMHSQAAAEGPED